MSSTHTNVDGFAEPDGSFILTFVGKVNNVHVQHCLETTVQCTQHNIQHFTSQRKTGSGKSRENVSFNSIHQASLTAESRRRTCLS